MIIFMCIEEIKDAVIDTINPKEGNGAVETLVVLILVIAWVCYIGWDIAVPPEFMGVISIVIGYMFGRNEKK